MPSLKRLKTMIHGVHGEHGARWWQNLPTLLQQLSDQLQITLQQPFDDLSFHYVAMATGVHSEQWVLKCGVPSDTLHHEIKALRHYRGHGTVALIDADSTTGWLLLQRCMPGTPLIHHQEQDAIPIAVSVMQQLWHHPPQVDEFLQVSHWLKKLDTLHRSTLVNQHVPSILQDFAHQHAVSLLQQTYQPVLLHGDLHYQNILHHQDRWLAIDPKGVIGPPEFELASFMRNPQCVQQNPTQERRAIARNIDQMIELTQFDRQIVVSWAIVQAVLWVYWYLEDNLPHEAKPVVQFAQQLYGLHSPQ
jgi:streptomycin 6-kinase